MSVTRRGFLGTILTLAAAPAIVRASSLMPVVALRDATTFTITGLPWGLYPIVWGWSETECVLVGRMNVGTWVTTCKAYADTPEDSVARNLVEATLRADAGRIMARV